MNNLREYIIEKLHINKDINPKIDFKILQNLTTRKIKEVKNDLF